MGAGAGGGRGAGAGEGQGAGAGGDGAQAREGDGAQVREGDGGHSRRPARAMAGGTGECDGTRVPCSLSASGPLCGLRPPRRASASVHGPDGPVTLVEDSGFRSVFSMCSE